MSDERTMGQVIRIDEARIRDHLGEMVRDHAVAPRLKSVRNSRNDQRLLLKCGRRGWSSPECLVAQYSASWALDYIVKNCKIVLRLRGRGRDLRSAFGYPQCVNQLGSCDRPF